MKRYGIKSFLIKACPRCHGDLILDVDPELGLASNGLDYVCLQCGRPARLVEEAPQTRQRAAAVA